MPGPKRFELPLPAALAALAALAAAALYLYREHQVAGAWGYSLDDAWIHAVIARNFASGHGWSFNPGETTGASTGPLFTFLLAAFYTVTGPSVWVSKGIGIACHALASALACVAVTAAVHGAARGERRGGGASRPAWTDHAVPLLAGLLVATSPSLVWSSVSGMEVPLYEALLLTGLVLHFQGRGGLATAVWGLGVWVRPDGALLALLSAAVGSGRLRDRLVGLAAVLAPYLAVQALIGHAPLPATVYTKAHLGSNPWGQWGKYFATQRGLWGLPARWDEISPHSPLLLAGLVAGAIAGGRACLLPGVYVVLFSVAFGLISPNAGPQFRYALPLIPVTIVLTVVAMTALTSRFTRQDRGAVLVGAGLLILAPEWLSIPRASVEHGWNVQNINGMHRFLGERFRETTAPSDRIATNDVGAIGFFSGRYIVDVAGLVSPRSPLPDLLTAYRPRYLAVFPSWYHDYARIDAAANTLYFDDADGQNRYWATYYVELERNTIAARDKMFVCERTPRGAPPPPKLPMYRH